MHSSKSNRLLAIALACAAFAPPLAMQSARAATSTRIDVYAAYSRKDDAFRRIQPGMRAEQVIALIGTPDRKMRFDATRTTSWDYQFRDTWGYDAEFSVIFGDDGLVSSTVSTRLDD